MEEHHNIATPKPPSMRSILKRRPLVSTKNQTWTAPIVAVGENLQRTGTSTAMTVHADDELWNKFSKICGDISAQYDTRPSKRQAQQQQQQQFVVVPNAALGDNIDDNKHHQGSSLSLLSSSSSSSLIAKQQQRDNNDSSIPRPEKGVLHTNDLQEKMLERILAKEILSIEQAKSSLNMERIKVQIELLHLLDQRLKVANQQDATAAKLLKVWQERRAKAQQEDSWRTELAKRATAAYEIVSRQEQQQHQQLSMRQQVQQGIAAAAVPTIKKNTDMESPSKVFMSTASAGLLKKVMQDVGSITLPTPPPSSNQTKNPFLDVLNQATSTQTTSRLSPPSAAAAAAREMTTMDPCLLLLGKRKRDHLSERGLIR